MFTSFEQLNSGEMSSILASWGSSGISLILWPGKIKIKWNKMKKMVWATVEGIVVMWRWNSRGERMIDKRIIMKWRKNKRERERNCNYILIISSCLRICRMRLKFISLYNVMLYTITLNRTLHRITSYEWNEVLRART